MTFNLFKGGKSYLQLVIFGEGRLSLIHAQDNRISDISSKVSDASAFTQKPFLLFLCKWIQLQTILELKKNLTNHFAPISHIISDKMKARKQYPEKILLNGNIPKGDLPSLPCKSHNLSIIYNLLKFHTHKRKCLHRLQQASIIILASSIKLSPCSSNKMYYLQSTSIWLSSLEQASYCLLILILLEAKVLSHRGIMRIKRDNQYKEFSTLPGTFCILNISYYCCCTDLGYTHTYFSLSPLRVMQNELLFSLQASDWPCVTHIFTFSKSVWNT